MERRKVCRYRSFLISWTTSWPAVLIKYSWKNRDTPLNRDIPIIKKGIRLDPIATAICLNIMAIAYRMVGQYDKAIAYLETATKRYPDHLFSHLNLSACYILAGREKEALLEAKEVLRLKPKFSVDRFANTLPLKNQEEKKRFLGALSVAFADQSSQ